MRIQETVPDRRSVGYFATPITIIDSQGREVATLRSPRKLGKALISDELVLLAGDTVIIGKIRVVS
jgi:hypothetical protein